MKLFSSFLRLIRLPNLLFILFTQFLYYYCSFLRVQVPPVDSTFSSFLFILLMIASVLIAAAGYVINDYFDLNIDRVNKPGRMVIEKVIKRRWAIMWHILLSLAGLLISFYIDLKAHTFWLGLANLLCILMLFGYSVTLKKKLLIGNIVISLLTAWVIMVVYLCFQHSFLNNSLQIKPDPNISSRLTRMTLLYAGFAFVISLIREAVKDMEDMEGDARYGCQTMPIVWKIPAAKVYVGVWVIVLIGVLVIVQFYVLQFGWWSSAVYCLFLIIIPLVWILRALYQAKVSHDYHVLSRVIKGVMLTGILSMLFFKLYA